MNRVLFIFFVFIGCSSNNKSTECVQHSDQLAKEWTYFIPKNTLEVELLYYYPALTRCGRAIINGLAIAKTDEDTIRIIDQCPGQKDYKFGDILIFEPDFDPPKNNNLGLIYIDGKLNPAINKYSFIKRTSFGYLEREKN